MTQRESYQNEQRFMVTDDHLKLLRAAWVTFAAWMEFGAPAIDPKRPYGNGGVYRDMVGILGWEPEDPSGADFDEAYSHDQRDALLGLHKETATALQIVLATGTFEPGQYVAPKYGKDWRRA